MITLMEILDMLIMTAFVGYIFRDIFGKFQQVDVLTFKAGAFDWNAFKFAALITAPGLILHELAHKFVAMGFGMEATFHAAYPWLVLGLVMKLLNFGFIMFVPAFVSISGFGSPLQFSIIAFAGPGMNLLLWLGTNFLIKNNKIPQKHMRIAFLTKEINKLLFIFNMIPLFNFDGAKVLSGLVQTFF